MTEDGKIETLANTLRERIKRGDFGTDGRLPPVTQLAKDYQMSRTTVYQALLFLQSESLLLARGNSYFVNYPIMRIPDAPLFDKYMEEQGLTPIVENIAEPEVIRMSAEVAKAFGQQEGLHVVHRMRRHGIIEIPYRLAENWYPADLAAQFLDAMKQDPTLNILGEIRKAHGLAWAKRHDDIIARLPTDKETELLSIVRTTPIIEVRQQWLTQEDRVLLFNITLLIAAYFQLSYDTEKQKKQEEVEPPKQQ
ncbi:MAG: GntR family transcriptional regulator [Ktedonobacteraceae bacterium]|nr:GntR family transcriptional regulator [Ktedonobacteraceae bacterium]